ncbi:glucokinase [Sulfurovum sp.]|uniref:glucokinase n=1 Tax=Sulfurovum sp. TaxID=1969726 RepID=UPI0025D64DF7|nr:glucokinase [Sulfurovum sp.]
MILAGDIGGTKTNLALYEINAETPKVKVQHQFVSREHQSLTDVIKAFELQTSISQSEIKAACFGIAGPVINGRCRTTNLPWDITTQALQEYLGTQKIKLLNDLESTAYGMLYLKDEEFVQINPSGRKTEGNRAVIAAGTGLGEALLYYDGTDYHPVGSEGGHTDLAPLRSQHDELLQWLRKRYHSHVSYERILSGPGIYALYEFLKESGFAAEPISMMHLPEETDKSAMVSKCALEEHDPLCVETLRLFAEFYGAEAGNLALKTMSIGGLYIGGGIAPKILPFLTDDRFVESFVAKGRFEELLRGIEVKVALNQETSLLGAAHFAADKLL